MDNIMFLLLFSPALSVVYEISITTSTSADSKSDSTFFYTVEGTEGNTAEFKADLQDYNDRQSGATDTW